MTIETAVTFAAAYLLASAIVILFVALDRKRA